MLLSIDIQDPVLLTEQHYHGSWAGEAQTKQSGTANVWLPMRDINGISEAITALHRLSGRHHAESLSPAQRAERTQLLTICIKLLTAERELLLRDFAKLLANALNQASKSE